MLILFVLSFIYLLYFGVLGLLKKRCQILCRYSLIFQLLNQIHLQFILNFDKWWFLLYWSLRKKNRIILCCFAWNFARFSFFGFTLNWWTKAEAFSGSLCDKLRIAQVLQYVVQILLTQWNFLLAFFKHLDKRNLFVCPRHINLICAWTDQSRVHIQQHPMRLFHLKLKEFSTGMRKISPHLFNILNL